MPVRITTPITLNQIANSAGLPTDRSMKSIAGSLVGSLIAGVYPPNSTRANHNISEYLYAWAGVQNQRVVADGSEFLLSSHGDTVVISGDGNTMAEISQFDNYRVGAIRIWIWDGSSWVQQARLVPPYTIDQFADYELYGKTDLGGCIGISSAGNTLMVSSSINPNANNLLLMYTRSGTTWTLSQQIVLPSSTYVGKRNIVMTPDSQLIFVSTYDGLTVYARSGNAWNYLTAINASFSHTYQIAASSDGQYVTVYRNSSSSATSIIDVYSRSGNTWNFHSTITPVNVKLDRSVYCLNDSGTVLVAKTENINGAGCISFYTRSGTTWTEQQNTYYQQSTTPFTDYPVDQIVMNSAGTVVAVGGFYGSIDQVSIWTSSSLSSWTNSQTWTYSNSKGASNNKSLGISSNGNRLVVGLPESIGDQLGRSIMYHYNGSSFVQQGSPLVGTGDVTMESGFGKAVTMTADGSRMFSIAISVSKVLIHDRNGSGQWFRSSETLSAPGDFIGGNTPIWGESIDASADGRTVAVGSRVDNGGIGAVWVYMKDAVGVWSTGQKLVGSGYVGAPQFGCSVSMSADGNTLVVGGFGDDNYVGSFWIFTRSGNTWTQLGSKRLPSDRATNPGANTTNYANNQIGKSVSISADGNTIAVGAPFNSIDTGLTVISNGVTYRLFRQIGAAWIFTRSGTTWTQQGNGLIGTGYYNPGSTASWEGNIYQGTSISLSADGNTLAVGAYGDGDLIDEWFLNPWREGAVWVFTRSGTSWTQQGDKLAIPNATSSLGLGTAVSLSASGNVLGVGAGNYKKTYSFSTYGEGAGAVFTRENGAWTNQTGILVGTNLTSKHWSGASQAGFGTGVKVSASGRTIIFSGAGLSNTYGGAVWDFK